MSSKNDLLRVAIAAAIAAAAAQSASALDISLYNSSTVNVYLSGSTAVDNTLLNTAVEINSPFGLCVPGTADVYYEGTASSYSNRLIFCTASSSSGITSGTQLAIFKESTIGSQNGVTPLYTAAAGGKSGVVFIDANALKTAGCAANGTGGGSHGLATYTNHPSCSTSAVTSNIIPTAGFSDVEPAILRTPSGGTVSVTEAGTYLSEKPTLDQVWSVALTKNAYYALQAAEGYATGDSPANAASLSGEQFASLLTGQIFEWSDIGLAPADNNVYLCRRDIGSGTEASYEAEFVRERCGLPDLAVLGEDAAVTWANGSGSQVRGCLQNMFIGGTQTAFYPLNSAGQGGSSTNAKHHFPAANQYAIGFLNAETSAANVTAASDSFRFIAIDGSGPTVPNVINGNYPYFSSGLSFTIKTGVGVPTGSPSAVVATLLGKLGHPAFTADSNQSYNGVLPFSPTDTAGDVSPAGVYNTISPATVIPVTSAYAATNPTNAYTKSAAGSINNCDVPTWDQADLVGTVTTSPQSKLLGTGNINN